MKSAILYLQNSGYGPLAAELAVAGRDDVRDLAHKIRDQLPEIERREQKILDALDLWVEKGVLSKRALKTAMTKYIATCKDLLKFNMPTGLRPGEREKIEEWRSFVEQTTVANAEKEVKALAKLLDSSIATQEYAAKFKSTFEYRAGGVAKEIRETALPNIYIYNVMEEQTEIGTFTVIDDYGTPESRFEPWIGIIHRAVSILKRRDLGYLCYGKLKLSGTNSSWGMYYQNSDSIELSVSASRPVNDGAMLYTLIHELGHRLWYKFMDTGHRKAFSSPWIEQDEMIQQAYENTRIVLDTPMNERVEAFNLVYGSNFNFGKFKKWMEESPEKKIRWLNRLKWTPANAEFMYVEQGELNKAAFEWASKRLEDLRSQLNDAREKKDLDWESSLDDSLRKFEERQRKYWTEEHDRSDIKLDDVKRAFEPGTGRIIKTPISELLIEVLKLHPVRPSVSDYGNQSREEDFAETFAAVLLGTAKSHEVVMRLQRALPKGTVANVTAGIDDDLKKQIEEIIESYDKTKAAKLGEWFESTFRVKSPQTPRGQKELKEKATALIWYLRHGNEKYVDSIKDAWSFIEPRLGDLVRHFSDEGGKVVPVDMTVGSNVYLNKIGFDETKFEKYVDSLESLFATLKGWRKHALTGGVTTAIAGPREFRGTAAGVYKSSEDTLYVRATPAVLKRTSGTYGAPDYIIVHELGHRYERKAHVREDFDKQHWWTTEYSRKEGESFAEMFALGHFGITKLRANEFATTLENFDAAMTGKKVEIREVPTHLKDIGKPVWTTSDVEVLSDLKDLGYTNLASELTSVFGAIPKDQYKPRRKGGQYSYRDMEKLCKCGHKLGKHTAEAPHECIISDTDAVDCDCVCFKPK